MTKNECPGTPTPTSQQSSGGRCGPAAVEAAASETTMLSVAPTLSTPREARGRRTVHLRNDARLLAQRPPQRRITHDFMAAWRTVDEPLRCYLAGMGLNRHDIDDITQETATRAMEGGMSAAEPGDLRPWAFVVARRLAIDLFRVRLRCVGIDEAQGPDVRQEVALARVEDRHLLRTVASKVAVLPRREQDSLAASSVAQTAAERNSANVARHRARRRLRHLVGPLAAAVAWARRQGNSGVAVGGTLAAAALPFVVLSGHHHGEPAAPTVVRADQMPSSASEVALVGPQRASRRTGRSEPVHRVHPALTSPPPHATAEHKVVSAKGPGGSWVSVGHHPPSGSDPLICVGGSDLPKVCIASPPRGLDAGG